MLTERLAQYSAILNQVSLERLGVIVEAFRLLRAHGNTVYVAGNGGSCANAAHLVLHLREEGVRAVDLGADPVCLTAAANDYSYAEIFEKSLQSQAVFGDALLVISGSGQSPNILRALAYARSNGIDTMGLLGFGGGDSARLCSAAVILESSEYGPVEVTHDACIHLIKELLAGVAA